MRKGLPPNDPLRSMGPEELAQRLDEIVESWRPLRSSGHLKLEISAVFTRGAPLDPGTSVPGCTCPACTGLPENHPARRRRPWRKDREWEAMKEKAQKLPVLDVARKLGLQPHKVGREYMARCPLHDDRHPSLSINPHKGVWHCFSCQEGGDAIRLYMKARRVDFATAVRELVGAPARPNHGGPKNHRPHPYPTSRTRRPSDRHLDPSNATAAGHLPPLSNALNNGGSR